MSATTDPNDAIVEAGAAIRIVPCDARHAAAAAALVLAIQREEFGFDITLEQQPDLAEIAAFYQHGAGNFWVALDGDAVVGTIALKDIGDRQVALRKMFVAATHRGGKIGIAAQLLDAALHWAAQKNVRSVLLGTTEKFRAAHRFYEKHGFAQVTLETLPTSFPRMALDTRFYRLDLAPATSLPDTA